MDIKSFKVSSVIPKNFKVVTCLETDDLTKAKTLIPLNDFSQLPVMSFQGKILGVISWKTISKKNFGAERKML
ncbi:hypothetical protein [Pedobacter suwonensis]|uniref:hypothetical protein n=1 Tax=Pedobacter suwonensis TaxID=332999 RepID=UPI003689894E